MPTPPSVERRLLAAQGGFYLAAGVWPLLDRASFEKVTGPKTDFWLVRTVGALIAVTGASLIVAARRRWASEEAKVLAAGSAAALATVDVVYSRKGRISPVYLLDAAVELALLGAWAAASASARRGGGPPEILAGE
ncbi:MAG TPA: hypothetical protein VK911_12495 [Vicinamibacterales bacterium]|nr:hypothetical protein [Vicinamibacterales bacterium]